MKIGAQLYTVRDFTKIESDFEATLNKIAKMGYSCIQMSGVGKIAPERVREIADNNGLEIAITHTDKDRILNDTIAVINEHKIMGCKHIGIGYVHFDNPASSNYYKLIQDYSDAAKLINKNGMKLHYHNHAHEFQRFGDKTGFEILVNETDPQLWGFILDVYWVQIGGKNPVDIINQLNGRIDAIHLKDLAMNNDKQQMAEIMEGNLDWTKIIEACENTNIKYAMVEQDSDWAVGPLESLETSYNNLNNFFIERGK